MDSSLRILNIRKGVNKNNIGSALSYENDFFPYFQVFRLKIFGQDRYVCLIFVDFIYRVRNVGLKTALKWKSPARKVWEIF